MKDKKTKGDTMTTYEAFKATRKPIAGPTKAFKNKKAYTRKDRKNNKIGE